MLKERIQVPPDYTKFPTVIRTTHTEFKVNVGKKVQRRESVDVPDPENNLLLYFMGIHAVKKLTPEMYVLYHLMWKHWGEIDRKSIFKLTGVGISEPSDKDEVNSKVAKALGSKISDMATAMEFYMSTWNMDSVKPIAKMCHPRIRVLIPVAYKISSRMMSDGFYSKHKNFNDAAAFIYDLRNTIHPLYDEQIQLASTVSNHERRDWLNEMSTQTKVLHGAIVGIIGRSITSSLLFK